MSKELKLSDFPFTDALFLKSLSEKPRTKVQMMQYLSPRVIKQLEKKNILVMQMNEQTNIPYYTFRDGFIDG